MYNNIRWSVKHCQLFLFSPARPIQPISHLLIDDVGTQPLVVRYLLKQKPLSQLFSFDLTCPMVPTCQLKWETSANWNNWTIWLPWQFIIDNSYLFMMIKIFLWGLWVCEKIIMGMSNYASHCFRIKQKRRRTSPGLPVVLKGVHSI